jgi:exodeoxyribonuclease V beta subunit
MLKGFIDLVFVHDGKYYVLDWKSNHLGDQSSEYSKQALENAIVEHRYDFQYQIYALALHRYLRSRIEDYRYETHFGGVYYLFLRGIDGSENGIFYNCPDREFIAQFDRLVDGNQMEVIHA